MRAIFQKNGKKGQNCNEITGKNVQNLTIF